MVRVKYSIFKLLHSALNAERQLAAAKHFGLVGRFIDFYSSVILNCEIAIAVAFKNLLR
jgi:hypothetical protein